MATDIEFFLGGLPFLFLLGEGGIECFDGGGTVADSHEFDPLRFKKEKTPTFSRCLFFGGDGEDRSTKDKPFVDTHPTFETVHRTLPIRFLRTGLFDPPTCYK